MHNLPIFCQPYLGNPLRLRLRMLTTQHVDLFGFRLPLFPWFQADHVMSGGVVFLHVTQPGENSDVVVHAETLHLFRLFLSLGVIVDTR